MERTRTNLGDFKESQEIGHLDGRHRRGGTDDARNDLGRSHPRHRPVVTFVVCVVDVADGTCAYRFCYITERTYDTCDELFQRKWSDLWRKIFMTAINIICQKYLPYSIVFRMSFALTPHALWRKVTTTIRIKSYDRMELWHLFG